MTARTMVGSAATFTLLLVSVVTTACSDDAQVCTDAVRLLCSPGATLWLRADDWSSGPYQLVVDAVDEHIECELEVPTADAVVGEPGDWDGGTESGLLPPPEPPATRPGTRLISCDSGQGPGFDARAHVQLGREVGLHLSFLFESLRLRVTHAGTEILDRQIEPMYVTHEEEGPCASSCTRADVDVELELSR